MKLRLSMNTRKEASKKEKIQKYRIMECTLLEKILCGSFKTKRKTRIPTTMGRDSSHFLRRRGLVGSAMTLQDGLKFSNVLIVMSVKITWIRQDYVFTFFIITRIDGSIVWIHWREVPIISIATCALKGSKSREQTKKAQGC